MCRFLGWEKRGYAKIGWNVIIIAFIGIILLTWFISILKVLNKFHQVIIGWLDYYKLLLNEYVILIIIDNNLSEFNEFVYKYLLEYFWKNFKE